MNQLPDFPWKREEVWMRLWEHFSQGVPDAWIESEHGLVRRAFDSAWSAFEPVIDQMYKPFSESISFESSFTVPNEESERFIEFARSASVESVTRMRAQFKEAAAQAFAQVFGRCLEYERRISGFEKEEN